MTDHYDPLSSASSVFGQLRNLLGSSSTGTEHSTKRSELLHLLTHIATVVLDPDAYVSTYTPGAQFYYTRVAEHMLENDPSLVESLQWLDTESIAPLF